MGKMKIGVFDSGLGGLVILRALIRMLPQYDYVYFGDTLHMPYGEKSPSAITKYTQESVGFLFRQNCALVIIACNTASATALKHLQQQYLPKNYPDRRILGVVVPTLEAVVSQQKKGVIGILATNATVRSKAYPRELRKLSLKDSIIQIAASELVPIIESNNRPAMNQLIRNYARKFRDFKTKTVVLACTHFPVIVKSLKRQIASGTTVLSQEEIIPKKLAEYIRRHPELEAQLSRKGRKEFFITKRMPRYKKIAKSWFGGTISLKTARP